MLYLYLDESGDLGFDFENHKPSNYFVVAILIIKGRENRKIISNAVRRTLYNKINSKRKNKKNIKELKGINTSLNDKKYFFSHLKKADFCISSITLDKRRFPKNIAKSRLYGWLTSQLLQKINFFESNYSINFILDKRMSKVSIAEFNDYITKGLEILIDPKIPFDIEHKDSISDYCLSAVDLFAWGIAKKYEQNNEDWYNCFKEKIKIELFLPEK